MLVSTLIVFLIEAAIIVVLGRLLFGVPFPGQPLSLALALLLGAGVFAALGLGITAAVRSAEGSSAVDQHRLPADGDRLGNVLLHARVPGFLKAIAEILPLTHFTLLARHTMLDGRPIWTQGTEVGAVAIWGAIGLVAAVKGFRWEPREG